MELFCLVASERGVERVTQSAQSNKSLFGEQLTVRLRGHVTRAPQFLIRLSYLGGTFPTEHLTTGPAVVLPGEGGELNPTPG